MDFTYFVRPTILIILLILSFTKYRNNKNLFSTVFLIYFIFLSLRCGQGLDYFSYGYYYNIQGNIISLINDGLAFPQFGIFYNLIVSLFKTFNLPFEFFLMCINFFVLFSLKKFIERYSKNYLLSFFILFAVYGVSILESSLRQIISLSIILGFIIPLIEKKKWKECLLLGVVALDFHPSTLIILVVLIFLHSNTIFSYINKYKIHCILVFIVIIICVQIIGLNNIFMILPDFIKARIGYYFQSGANYSFYSIGLRIIYLIIALYLIKRCILSENQIKIVYLYIIGILVYLLFSGKPIFSRLTLNFEILEIVIITYLFDLSLKNVVDKVIIAFYCAICCILFFKDSASIVELGMYKTDYLPYITIFEKYDLDNYIDENNTMFKLYKSTIE